MILLNYAHPLHDQQLSQLERMLGSMPEVRDLPNQVDRSRSLAALARELADAAGLRPRDWQTQPLLVNPPGLAPIALALIAELHGRCGGFLSILSIRPVAGSTPTRYEIAEISNLQTIRDTARLQRTQHHIQ